MGAWILFVRAGRVLVRALRGVRTAHEIAAVEVGLKRGKGIGRKGDLHLATDVSCKDLRG